MRIIDLPAVDSTNTYLSGIAAESENGTVVVTHAQTAGRGQRGNSWESAPGENITMSLLLRPSHIAPAAQLAISQAVSVAIVNVLKRYLPDREVSIKWPNDIYVDDRKICGILIENTISGHSIEYSIVGVGINVNQREFLSDAPNPVSLTQLTCDRYDVSSLVTEFVTEILSIFNKVDISRDTDGVEVSLFAELSQNYAGLLWRRDGYYPYHDNIRDVDMMAAIRGVAPTGHITLVTLEGETYVYAFKEITAILS